MSKELFFFTKKITNRELIEDFSFSYKELDFDKIDFLFSDEIKIKYKVSLATKEFVFRCDLKTEIVTECDLCLKKINVSILIKDYIFSYENVNQDFIDMTPDIRDAVLLEIPTKTVCSNNCKGLCPKCKTDLNEKQCQCQNIPFYNPFEIL